MNTIQSSLMNRNYMSAERSLCHDPFRRYKKKKGGCLSVLCGSFFEFVKSPSNDGWDALLGKMWFLKHHTEATFGRNSYEMLVPHPSSCN